jgi:organic radical activating enzyme
MLIFVFSPETVFINMAMDFSKLTRIYSEPDTFRLTWVVNNICTQHCRYCPDMLHRGTNKTPWTMQEAQQFCDKIFALNKPVELSIAGGEPTLSPHLKPLIKLFKDRGHRVFLTSNGSRSVDYWQGLDIDQLTLSYHPSWAQGNWLDKLGEITKIIPKTTVALMMDPDYWDQCMIVYDLIVNDYPSVGLNPVRILDWGAEIVVYDKLQEQWLLQQQQRPPLSKDVAPVKILAETDQGIAQITAADLIRSSQNKFVGWQCSIGIDSLFVQFDGSIRKGNCEQDGYIGWIQDPEFAMPAAPTTCQVYLCHCATDVNVAKHRQFPRSKTIPIYKLPRIKRG